MKSSLARRITSLVGILVLTLVVAGPARATHETITIDGDLTDLINAINDNLGPANGGFTVPSDSGNVYTSKCRFVNGYDVRNFHMLVDLKNATGGAAATNRLYAGWDVFGQIGDVDGDGIVDAIGGIGSDPCALSDGPTGVAIGPLESYRIVADLNCDFVEDFTIIVKNDAIEIQLPGGAVVPPQDPNFPDIFARNGSFLELQIGRLEQLAPGMDLCNASFLMTADAENDGPGEDFGFMGQLEIQPSVAITKTPPKQTVAAGQANATVTWTIEVTNNGSCNLSSIRVDDVLDAGMTFLSSTPGRDAGGTTQNSVWTFPNVAPGQSRTITLNAQVTGQCTGGPFFNNATATGTHTPAAACGLPARTATANVSAEVNCTVVEPPPCSITGPAANCLGEPLELCGPDETALGRDLFYTWTAPDGAVTTSDVPCMTFAVPLSGVYSLVVRDVVTGQETGPCTKVFKVNKLPFCFIAAPQTACEGDHVQICGPQGDVSLMWTLPDGSNSTAQCLSLNPVTAAHAGEYKLVVTDNATGCKSAECTATLVVNEKPICMITSTVANPVTPGANVDLCGPAGNFTYAWTLPDGSTQTGQCVNIVNAQPANAGLYTLVVTDATNGCSSAPCTYFLSFESTPIVCLITGAGKYQAGTTIELCGPVGPFTYLWTRPDGSTQTGRCLTVGPLVEADEGHYQLIVTDASGNSVTCSEKVSVNGAKECENCPRTADFWEDQCDDKGKDHSRFTTEQLDAIAQCVDDLSDFFDFGGSGNPVIPPPVAGSEWKYNDQGVDLGTAWREVGYADGSWPSGPGVLGYGESYVTTVVSYGPDEDDKHPTTYFRYNFSLNDASSVTGMTLRLMYDDGACVYLNGVEVTRRSLRSGTPAYGSWAYNHEAYNSYETINIGSFVGLLQSGANVLAVEVHQTEASSSDLIFDAELQLTGAAPIAMTAGMPTDGSVLGDDDDEEEEDGFCAVLNGGSKNDRSEAKRQFAALLANICATGLETEKGEPICLNIDTEIDCDDFQATTIEELIDEIDALLAQLEGQPLHGDVEDTYEKIVECLEDINNGWSIDVPKDCEDDDDDKKGRMTPSGDDVVVELGPMATVMFSQVAIEGTTYLEMSSGWVLPQGLMAVEGKACVITSTATYSGDIEVSLRYDEALLQSPEEDLKLLRFDYGTHTWTELAAVLDPVANRISGPAADLSAFVVATPWAVLSADDPGRGLEFGIKQSFPNPTGGRTTIRYALTKSSPVHLSVHDIQGRQVAVLASGTLSAGEHTAVWNGRRTDGSKMPAGIYMIRLQSAEGMRTSKLVMMN